MYIQAVQSLHYYQFLTRHNLITQPDYTTWLHNLTSQPDCTTWLHNLQTAFTLTYYATGIIKQFRVCTTINFWLDNLITQPDYTTWLHNLQTWHTCFFCSGENVEGATLVPCDCSNCKSVIRVGIKGTKLYDNCALIGWPRLWPTILWTGHLV